MFLAVAWGQASPTDLKVSFAGRAWLTRERVGPRRLDPASHGPPPDRCLGQRGISVHEGCLTRIWPVQNTGAISSRLTNGVPPPP